MRSSEPSPDLELGPGTSEADREALRRARAASRQMSWAEYLEFLASLPDESPERLRQRKGPRGPEPFTLPTK
jgi:hypothetical protein